MALIFTPSSALSFCFKSKLTHRIKPCPKSFPTLPTKCLSRPVLASTSVKNVTRRTGNHHANLWDDDFIQSLPKLPYDAPQYRERADRLVGEVKDMFNAAGAADSCADNILKRLQMVDKVERLGIGRHFEMEIAEALDYVYRFWNESSKDLNTAALGLRILRLHRYPVSSDVLEQFKAKDGQFLCCTTQIEGEIQCILNLFRASLIAFPNEKIMDEAQAFSTMYLKQILEKSHILGASLLKEITFNLEYRWRTNLPRLEARNYIDIYGENISWLMNMDNQTILYLAKLDFNILQSLYRPELQIISRWWRDSRLYKLDFCRHRHIEYLFQGCAITGEPKHLGFRIAFAKFSALATIVDDIYDTYGSIEELKHFTEAFKRWDSTPPDYLPEYMKITYSALYDGIIESAQEASKIQGYETLHNARKAWDDYLDAVMQEAQWIANGHIPNLKEYVENGRESSGSRTTTLQSLLTLDALPENEIQNIDHPSKFNYLFGLTLRLRGDTRTFKTEADRGEVASAIACYMKEHPESSEKDALKYLNFKLDEHLKELNLEYLKNDGVPNCIKDYAYDCSRCFEVFYKERDGFSISTKDMKNHVERILIEPIKM
ncbi:alpha pinene synthase, chloroplastic-like [Cryptomeria japonica]|uniref:alpha pinene synthase, chloroplastic-like n=1 Tax=Cryptomeria japonica TaxID=3369 RepID=UPI0027DA0064|nr:alpha pinene synthase, chloroplastic-like [Cryptomeria japonica]